MIGKLVGLIAMNLVFFAWTVARRLMISKFVHTMLKKLGVGA